MAEKLEQAPEKPGVPDDFDWDALKGIDWDALGEMIEKDKTAFTKILNERFPAFAWALEVPELKDLLDKAVDEEWTPETFDAQFRETDWFTQRTEQQRAFDIKEQTDPSSLQAEIDDQIEAIASQASRMFGDGAVGEDVIAELARRRLRSGASDAEVAGALLDAAERSKKDIVAGDYAAAQTGLRNLARDHMTTLSQEEVDTWTRKIVTGEMTSEGVGALLRERSKSRFPALTDLIDQGVSLTDYFSEHQRTIAQMMGMGVNQVDLVNDQRWAPVMGFADDSGTLRPMTAAETQRFVRSTNDYYRTDAGRTEAAGLKRNLAAAMGVTG